MTASIAIIGGGIGGLATAWHLRQRLPTASITVHDAAPRFGGVIATHHDPFAGGELVLEAGPDSIVSSKPAGLALINALGLGDQVQGTEPTARRSLIARGTRLIPVPEGLYLLAPGRFWPFVWSPILSWRGKLRLTLDLVKPPGGAAISGGDETLAAFVRRRLGREALQRIAQPLVSGIYTADPEQLSLQATMPQFIEMERNHRSLLMAMRHRMRDAQHAAASGPRYGLFISLRGGLQVLVDRLVDQLTAAGVILRSSSTVSALRQSEDGRLAVHFDGAASETMDRAVLCQPAYRAAAVLRDLDPALSQQLAAIPYASVATVNLAWRADRVPVMPPAAGFVVPAVEGRSLIAATFAHQKYGGRAPAGTVVLRAFVGGALHGHHLERDDAALVSALRDDLRDLLKIEPEPDHVRITRWPKAMAQYHLGHLERVRQIRAAESALGIALVGNGYEGVGIPDVIAQADQAAARIAAGLASG